MGKSKADLHSNSDVKMEVDEDVKPSVNGLLDKSVLETPTSAKVGQV